MSRNSASGQKEKTVTNFRQRKERTEVLSGWKTKKIEDETDISHWAKKRQLQDCCSDSNRQAPPKWDHYLCTVIKKCRALESVQVFIDESLSVSLKPTPSHLERQPTRVKLKHSSSMPTLNINKTSKIPEEDEHTKVNPATETVIKEENETISETVESSETKSSEGLIEGSHPEENSTDTAVNKDNDSSEKNNQISSEEDLELSQKYGMNENSENIDNEETLTDRTEETPSSRQKQSDSKTKSQDKPPPKFGYTRSNITLNIHPSFMPMSNGNTHFKAEDIRTESDNEYCEGEEGAQYETVKKLNFKVSLANPLKRQPTEKRVLHTTNLTHSSVLPDYFSKRALLPGHGAFSSKSESNISRIQDDSQVVAVTQVHPNSSQAINGMSVASLKSAKRVQSAITDTVTNESVQDGQEEKKMSQKQVMLVLKKVTLKDDLGDLHKEEKQDNPFHQTHALLSSHHQKYDLPATAVVQGKPRRHSHKEQGSKRSKSGKHKSICFPIGDLLPAVDTSIRNSMPARHYRSMEHPGLERDSVEGTNENILSYEDGISMMKQGIEIVRLKNNGFLGPPAFRPQNGKTPLQRAKENVSKRTYTNLPLSATQIAEVTDFSKTFWKSSAGSLYSNPVVRSRPGSRNEDEARARSSRLSKKWKADHQNTGQQTASELQQVSKTLSSRLNQLARQRGTEATEMVGRESVR